MTHPCIGCGKEVITPDRLKCLSCSHIGSKKRVPPIEERFFKKVNKDGPIVPYVGTPCWIWTGSIHKSGYGSFRGGSGIYYAHRFSYKLHYGELPAELDVLHKCDNKLCVNPSHLWLGTDFDNRRDMILKNRFKPPMGEKHGNAKLTVKAVLEIRHLYDNGLASQKNLAKQYGVDTKAIYDVVHRYGWKHVL